MDAQGCLPEAWGLGSMLGCPTLPHWSLRQGPQPQEHRNPSPLTTAGTEAVNTLRGLPLLSDSLAGAVGVSLFASLWSRQLLWDVGHRLTPTTLQGVSNAPELGGRASVIAQELQKSSWWPRREQLPRSCCQGRQGQGGRPACHRLGRGSASLRGSGSGSVGAVSGAWAWCRPSPPRFSEEGLSRGPAAKLLESWAGSWGGPVPTPQLAGKISRALLPLASPSV